MDPDDRGLIVTLLLAGGILVFVLARPALGQLEGALAWLVLGLFALAALGVVLLGTESATRLRHWLNSPFKGPAGWKKPR